MTFAALPKGRSSTATMFPGKDWAPPAPHLPGPHAHVRLVSRVGRTAGRDVWAAEIAGVSSEPLIVELLAEPLGSGISKGSRWVIDLRPFAAEGWPACAVLTRLPAALPDPYPRFQLISFIGLGGMGQVWMAEAPDYPDLALAVKFFTHPVYSQHPALLEQCLQEATVGIGIDSPFIARTYQLLDLRAHQAEGWPPVALVMRLYEPSLQRVLEDCRTTQSRLSLGQVLALARNLLDALDALHSGHGLVHRDVKPSNVLLRLPDDRPYRGPASLEGATALLSDLGTLCRAGQRPVFALGQDGWKAPELFLRGTATPDGERPADPAEDLFAFGLVLRALVDVAHSDSVASVPEPTATAITEEVTSPASSGVDWLRQVANELTAAEPLQRLTARAGLRAQLSGPGKRRVGGMVPQVAHYEVLERIGQGGMGEVYKAQDRRLRRLVALKVMREHFGGDSRERFLREAMAVGQLNHPNIVQIYDIGESEGRAYCALEYCGGGSLAARVRGRPMAPVEAARVVRTLAEVMHFAHKQGIIHRDLKPSNVLLTEGGALKIADFGLAKHLAQEGGLTQSGALLGTPSYMAPEQACGQREGVSAATDVYGLGAILYELLTGQPPFRGQSVHELLEQVRSQPPPPPRTLQPRIPRDLETICLKCLQKGPKQRYHTAQDLANDLRHWLGGEAIAARRVGRLERGAIWARRNRPQATLAALAALLLLLTVILGIQAWAANARARQATERERQEQMEKAASQKLLQEWRSLLEEWEKDEPPDPKLLLLHSALELGAQNYEEALRLARRARDLAGTNPALASRARELEQRALEGMRRLDRPPP